MERNISGATGDRSRRNLLTKGAVGSVAAGVAWTAPRVEGLTLRPDFASAQSSSGGSFDITFGFSDGAGFTSVASPAPGINSAFGFTDITVASSRWYWNASLVGPAAGVDCVIASADIGGGVVVGPPATDSQGGTPGSVVTRFQSGTVNVPGNINYTVHVVCS